MFANGAGGEIDHGCINLRDEHRQAKREQGEPAGFYGAADGARKAGIVHDVGPCWRIAKLNAVVGEMFRCVTKRVRMCASALFANAADAKMTSLRDWWPRRGNLGWNGDNAMKTLMTLVLAASLGHLAPALAQAPKKVASPALQKEFDGFIAKFSKAVYDRDGENNENYFIFCGNSIFAFTKTPAGFLFTEIGQND
jgi:hypothetical protein